MNSNTNILDLNSTLSREKRFGNEKNLNKASAVTSENGLNISINGKDQEYEIRYACIWVKNNLFRKYAFIYNQPHPKFFHKFEESKRNGLGIQSLNVYKTGSQQYRFNAVFVQSNSRCIISPFKGLSVDEFMRGFL